MDVVNRTLGSTARVFETTWGSDNRGVWRRLDPGQALRQTLLVPAEPVQGPFVASKEFTPMSRIFRPRHCVKTVTDLTLDRLRELDLDSLLLDVDCTLKRYPETHVSEEIGQWLGTIQGAGIGLCLVSNGRGPRIERFASGVGLPFIAKACKPFPWGLKRALREHGFDPKRTAMVGDQLLADIVAGNLAGLTTVLVRPIHPEEEQWFTRIKRPPERCLLRLMGFGKQGVSR